MTVRRGTRPIRRGSAITEAAIVLPVFLTLILGMIDLGIAVFQNNAVAEASRQGARIASVHGSLATRLGSWGPTAYTWSTYTGSTYSGTGNSSDTIPSAMNSAGVFAGLNPANVTISVTWLAPLDGGAVGNVADTGNLVQVEVSTNWSPVIFYVFGNRSVTLSATSIMPIAH